MFPDSAIAASYSYSQSYSKIAYMLRYGIADYLQNELLFDVKNVPYTFKFHETTTVQTKKMLKDVVFLCLLNPQTLQ